MGPKMAAACLGRLFWSQASGHLFGPHVLFPNWWPPFWVQKGGLNWRPPVWATSLGPKQAAACLAYKVFLWSAVCVCEIYRCEERIVTLRLRRICANDDMKRAVQKKDVIYDGMFYVKCNQFLCAFKSLGNCCLFCCIFSLSHNGCLADFLFAFVDRRRRPVVADRKSQIMK